MTHLPFYEAFEALYGSCERWQSDSLPGGKDLCLDKITRNSQGNLLDFMGQANILLSSLTALANSQELLRRPFAVLQSERSKPRDLRRAQRWLDEPGDDTPHIDRCRCDHVLQMRFRQPKIACLAQIADAHGL